MILQQTPLFGTHRARLAELALARCLPTQDGDREYAKAGGLMDLGGISP